MGKTGITSDIVPGDYFKEEDAGMCCAFFGCGKALTLQENLAGNFCINHQHKQKIEPSDYVQYPHKKSA